MIQMIDLITEEPPSTSLITGNENKFSKMFCRCCFSNNCDLFEMNERLLNTSDEEGDNIKLIDGYFELYGKSAEIPVIDGNAKICVDCWAKLQNAYTFRDTCLKTQKDLLDSIPVQVSDSELSEPEDTAEVQEIEEEDKDTCMDNKDGFKYCCMDCGALFQNVRTFEDHEKEHCNAEEVHLLQSCDLEEIEIDRKSECVPKIDVILKNLETSPENQNPNRAMEHKAEQDHLEQICDFKQIEMQAIQKQDEHPIIDSAEDAKSTSQSKSEFLFKSGNNLEIKKICLDRETTADFDKGHTDVEEVRKEVSDCQKIQTNRTPVEEAESSSDVNLDAKQLNLNQKTRVDHNNLEKHVEEQPSDDLEEIETQTSQKTKTESSRAPVIDKLSKADNNSEANNENGNPNQNFEKVRSNAEAKQAQISDFEESENKKPAGKSGSETFTDDNNLEASNENGSPNRNTNNLKKNLNRNKKFRNLKRHMSSMHVANHACKKCGQKFKCDTYLHKHMAVHEPATYRYKYVCKTCDRQFIYPYELRRHENSTHCAVEPLCCKVCDKKFKCPFNLKKHLRIHLPFEPKYSCDVCKKKFMYSYKLARHMKSHVPLKKFGCKICGRKFKNLHSLKIHSNSHAPHDQAIDCKTCGKRFNYPAELKRHMLSHQLAQPANYPCSVCEISFTFPFPLKRHMKTHNYFCHRAQQYICNYCNFKCLLKQDLREHFFVKCEVSPLSNPTLEFNQESVSTKTQEPVQNIIVENSSKQQQTATQLKRTKEIEAATDSYCCKQCANTFSSQATLDQHFIESHGSYVCHFCDKVYKDRAEIVRHLFIHRGFLPFNCPKSDCSYTNIIKSHFRMHLKKEHNILFDEKVHGFEEKNVENIRKLHAEKLLLKPITTTELIKHYKCSKCTASYPSYASLQRHNTVKHVKTIFQCKFCFQIFKERRFLWVHSFKHKTIGYPFICKECTFKTRKKRSFVAHLCIQHNITFVEKIHGYNDETYDEVVKYVLRTSFDDDTSEDTTTAITMNDGKKSSRTIVKPKRFR